MDDTLFHRAALALWEVPEGTVTRHRRRHRGQQKHATKLPLVRWADLEAVSATCTVLTRAGYEVAVVTDQKRTWLYVDATSTVMLRVGLTALLATDIVDSRLYRERNEVFDDVV